jgi:hypothetical protein
LAHHYSSHCTQSAGRYDGPDQQLFAARTFCIASAPPPADGATTKPKRARVSNSLREKNLFPSEPTMLMKKHAADHFAATLEGERLDSATVELKVNDDVNERLQDLKEFGCLPGQARASKRGRATPRPMQ